MSKVKVCLKDNLRTEILLESHNKVIKTDAVKSIGGLEEEYSPTDLLAAAWGSCILTTLGLQAKALKVDLKETIAYVEKRVSISPPWRLEKLKAMIYCPAMPEVRIKERLEKIAIERCIVHNSLHPDVNQEIVFEWGVNPVR